MKYRADAGAFQYLHIIHPFEICHSRGFEISKIDHVIYVAERIHFAPDDRIFYDYGKLLQQIFHISNLEFGDDGRVVARAFKRTR